MAVYRDLFSRFGAACVFEEDGRRVKKTIACLKYALELDGVISSGLVARGTKPLSTAQQQTFAEKYQALRERVRREVEPLWQTALHESGTRSAR